MEGRRYNYYQESRNTSSSMVVPHSPWHSPVPYLFGGLAAMLALISVALLILACSYLKLFDSDQRDLEAGDDEKPDNDINKTKPMEMPVKFVVIMAGDVKPTYIATPVWSEHKCTCDDRTEEAGRSEE